MEPMPADDVHVRQLCGAKKHGQDDHCRKPAGWGTNHAGLGRCRLHGGVSGTLVHGLSSRYVHVQLAPLIAQYQADPDPLNIYPELATLRACLQRFLDLHPELTDAELLVQEDAVVVQDNLSKVGRIVSQITGTVARIEKIRSENAISRPDLIRMLQYMAECVQDVVGDDDKCAQIRELWKKFRYGAGAALKGA